MTIDCWAASADYFIKYLIGVENPFQFCIYYVPHSIWWVSHFMLWLNMTINPEGINRELLWILKLDYDNDLVDTLKLLAENDF